MYDKIKTDTREVFLRLYSDGTLEDITGPVIRFLANVLHVGDMPISEALTIADEIDREIGEIALEKMRREADEE